MIKNSIGLAVFALALFFGATPVHAEEGIMPISQTPATDCIDDAEMSTDCIQVISTEESGAYQPTPETTTQDKCTDPDTTKCSDPEPTTPEIYDNCSPNSMTNCISQAGGSTHFEVDCSPATDCIEAEEEPAEWPMYLSLGALALVVIVFIVLNLFGGKRKK